LREVEAVALLCCESLGLEGVDYWHGYIQNWLYQGVGYNADAIPEKSAQKIFSRCRPNHTRGPTKQRASNGIRKLKSVAQAKGQESASTLPDPNTNT
jgi:hypothetical protein